MRYFVPFVAATLVSSLASTAAAADTQIVDIVGKVSLNHNGGGFQPIATATSGVVGDELMAAPGGRAAIVYADGCRVVVKPGQVSHVSDISPCSWQQTQGEPTSAAATNPVVANNVVPTPVAGGLGAGLGPAVVVPVVIGTTVLGVVVANQLAQKPASQ